jgi:hypothetical protein
MAGLHLLFTIQLKSMVILSSLYNVHRATVLLLMLLSTCWLTTQTGILTACWSKIFGACFTRATLSTGNRRTGAPSAAGYNEAEQSLPGVPGIECMGEDPHDRGCMLAGLWYDSKKQVFIVESGPGEELMWTDSPQSTASAKMLSETLCASNATNMCCRLVHTFAVIWRNVIACCGRNNITVV